VLPQTDGTTLVAGTLCGTYGGEFIVTRLTRHGTLDPAYGNKGWVSTAFNTNAFVMDAAMQSSGKLLVVGRDIGGQLLAAQYLNR
jgi:hypothetical protein